MTKTKKLISEKEIWEALQDITDPEIPVLNIVEMGIVRGVDIEDESAVVHITPTYSGCPAMVAIKHLVENKLKEMGVDNFHVKVVYEEAWTTDWMSEEAKKKLKEYGIAPPEKSESDEEVEDMFKQPAEKKVECPYCDSKNTRLQAEFGSTACKAQYFCQNCHQPFEYFKCH